MHYDSSVGGANLNRPLRDDPSFPPPPAATFPIGISKGRTSNATSEPTTTPPGLDPLNHVGSEKEGTFADVSGLQLWEMGKAVMGGLQGVLKLCSQSMEGGMEQGMEVKDRDTFPLPTSRNLLSPFVSDDQPWCTEWLMAVCIALNSMWGCQPNSCQEEEDGHHQRPVTKMQARVLRGLLEDVARLKEVRETTAGFEWEEFFRTRTIDYKGDEVKTALRFNWSNIKPALPREIGVAQLTEICEQGCRHHSCRILHLTDSLVRLHSMTRGRTSSRRLRRTLCRINSLLLAHNVVGLWGYVSTDLNPADRPSRWAVRTKFRHAKTRI